MFGTWKLQVSSTGKDTPVDKDSPEEKELLKPSEPYLSKVIP